MMYAQRLLFIFALFAVGCAATLNVSSHVDRAADFSVHRSYAWGPADALPTGDPRLDRNPFFVDLFQGAVEKQLRRRGLQLADNGASDLLIHFHATIQNRLDVDAIDRARGYCASVECLPSTSTYEAGTLVFDVVDANTNRLIWRGWVQTDLGSLLGNRARLAEVIENGVEGMFQHYPRELDLTAHPLRH